MFSNIWSQHRHSVSCMIMLFPFHAKTRSDLRPQVKQAVSLVVADGHLIFLMCLREYLWINIFNLLPSRACT